MSIRSFLQILGAAAVVGAFVPANAAEPFKFNLNGTGATGAITIISFDWTVGNGLAKGGNPPGGPKTGTKLDILSHARLAGVLDLVNVLHKPPADKEFTYVTGFGESVVNCIGSPCTTSVFAIDLTKPTNFFEIWVSTPNSNDLDGTGFQDGVTTTSKRILFGVLTDSAGIFSQIVCPNGTPVTAFDANVANDYPFITTICGTGSTFTAANIISVDPDYFPGFTPAQIANLKSFFNTSVITPFSQADPSAKFVPGDAGANGLSAPPVALYVVPSLGSVNGLNSGSTILDFQFQADANQSFEPGEDVLGACRVTYGGNDRNGNIDLTKFGSACSRDKNNTENCYTFGGQVGAPTANPNLGGPFGEHTHHQAQGPAGDFVFHAGTRSSPKSTRITATACKDPGACRQAEANAGFKQIDFEGTGSFRSLSDIAKAYLRTNGGGDILPDNASDRTFYFRVDMVDSGEPGNKGTASAKNACASFLALDANNPLNIADPFLLASVSACNDCPDVYQFYICKSAESCEQANAIYAVRGFLTGGNIQLHKIVK